MKFTARTSRSALVLLLLLLNVTAPGQSATQPPLSITKLTATTVAVSWFGTAGITYQLERSTNLLTWSNAIAPITGLNSSISVSILVTGQPKSYFRLKPPPPAANTAVFTASTGVLVIGGTDSNNTITVSRNAAGAILINSGAMPVSGGTPTVANTKLIEIFGKGGDDTITLSEVNGALPSCRMYGEAGNDVLTGGSAADALHGGAGNDTLQGKGGADILLGGDDNDSLTGGDADDEALGENGNDRMIWNPGDDTDLNEGGAGTDIVEVNGGNGAESFDAAPNGTRVVFQRVNPAPFSIDIGTSESLVLNANGGDDIFTASSNLAALISLTVDGGTGNDTLTGSNGADTFLGGDNNDTIDGNAGNDTIFAGAGTDTIIWDPGDGSDVIEGQADADTLVFNGSNANENIAVSANGSGVLFIRDVGNITMDVNDVETIEYNALAGTDNITVNDLTGTDLTTFIADLASASGTPDLVADTVIINGTGVDDVVTAAPQTADFVISGLAATVRVTRFDAALDKVRILPLAGDDVVDGSAALPASPLLDIDGGAGNDVLLGGSGGDALTGGDNDDVILANAGSDIIDGGTGENILRGSDGPNSGGAVSVFGDAAANTITISRNAAGSILTNGVIIPGATVANVTLIRVFGLGGGDIITLDETSGALPAAALFGGSGADVLTGGSGADFLFGGADNDTVQGKGGADLLFGGSGNDPLTGGDADDTVFGEGGNDRLIWNPGDDTDINEGGTGTDIAEVNGGGGSEAFLATASGARVTFARTDPAPFSIDIGLCESLVLNANGGNDTFATSGNLAPLISLTVDGGPGDDNLQGGTGADTFLGGDNNDTIDGNGGNDVIFAGAGTDTMIWDPGDGNDVVEGQGDSDTLRFNGSGANEIMVASANGGRVLFTRDVGNVVMDLNDVETIQVNVLNGTDSVTVNSLAGTDVTMIVADLAGSAGGGDSGVDTITLNGTAAVENFSLGTLGTAVTCFGITPTVRIFASEFANDHVVLNGLGGTDNISVGAGVTGLIDVDFNQ